MKEATPALQLRTLYVLDADGRIASVREPGTRRPPAFVLVRGTSSCAWGIRSDVPALVADELHRLAAEEPARADLRQAALHVERFTALVRGEVWSGPAFSFPDDITEPDGVVPIEDAGPLERHFPDLVDELEARSPVLGAVAEDHAVSICFCARRSEEAAEAGLQTAEPYRGRGQGPRVTAAWARAIRATGRMPLYSTSWTNAASLAVARKLGLVAYALDWTLWD